MKGARPAIDHGGRRWLFAGFVLALSLFATAAWLVHRQNAAAEAATARVGHTLDVLRAALELDAAVLMMENEHRGWLVRGDAAFAAARDRHHGAALRQLAALRRETRDNPAQQATLRAVRASLDARVARMRETDAVARGSGLDAARARLRAEGDGSLAPVRALLEDVRRREAALLAERTAAADAGAARLRWAIFAMPVAGLLVLFAAFRALFGALGRSEALRGDLAETEAMQRAMLDSSGYMVIAVDPDGVIRLFNRAATERLGWTAAELVGRETPALFHDTAEVAERAAALTAELGRPVAGFETFVARVRDGGVDDGEWTFVARDGRRFPVQLAVSAVRDDAGRLRGFIGLAQDISRRQAADREIRGLNDALQASVAELESFSYSVSHDLRAPLRHIDGYARMLAEDLGPDLPAEPRRFLDAISASSRRMGALIDDLLALSRLGRKPLARRAVDMTALAGEAWAEVTQDSRASIGFAIDALPPCEGDPALLRQVWLNLLSNAVKYSAPRGADAFVSVSGERTADTVAYHVQDNGVGFDPRYADKLFGVFQRLHPPDAFEGTGVGLAIVHRIVSRHGGNVRADSESGRGARFTFELPGTNDA